MRCGSVVAVTPVRLVPDVERRHRLARRHGLSEPLADVVSVARAMTCLHATEPASVHLAARARADVSLADVEDALYVDRSVVKQLAMRRTVFAFPRELLPAVWGSAAARTAGQQERRLAKEVQQAGLTDDGDEWVRKHSEALLDLLHQRGPMTTAEVRAAIPALDARLVRSPGKKYQAEVAVAGQVITTLAASGRILRGENDGHWKLSRARWTAASDWLGAAPAPVTEAEGYTALVRSWLWTFGPGTEADLVWWFGATKGAIRAALSEVGAVEVTLHPGAPEASETGYLLPDDLDEVSPSGDWAALLPAMDPTTMGWKQRGFYLGEHTARIFDVNGNAGPTAWWNGRIVGGWWQRPDGEVVVVPAERLPAAATAALDAEAARLTEWLDGEVVNTLYQTQLVRALARTAQ